MKFFHINFGSGTAANQSEILQKVKTAGGDGIQTSRGLLVKTELSPEDLCANGLGITVEATSAAELEADPDTAPDQLFFIRS